MIVLAGLPKTTDQRVTKRLESLKDLKPARYISVPFPKDPGSGCYSEQSITTLLRASAHFTLRQRRHQGELAPSRFYLIYVKAHDEENLLRMFDFFAFPVGVEIEALNRSHEMKVFEQLEPIVRRLLHDHEEAGFLAQAICGQSDKTPLLLPAKNFIVDGEETAFGGYLMSLRRREREWSNVNVRSVRYTHDQLPKAVKVKQTRPFFCDGRALVFVPDPCPHPPAREFDLDATTDELRALLNSLYRFGMPIKDGYHFDVQAVGRKLNAVPFVCIKQGQILVSGTHANVYPNDYVRYEK